MQETSGLVALATNPAVDLGRDTTINGTFATDTVWSKDASWVIAGNAATHTPGTATDISQDGIVSAGSGWQLIFTVSGRTAGSVTASAGGVDGTARSTNDTFTETIDSTGTDLDFTPTSDFDGDITAVSVNQTDIAASASFPGPTIITNGGFDTDTDWTKGDGWSIASGVAHSDGSQAAQSFLRQSVSSTIGNVLRFTFTLSGVSAGSIRARAGNAPGATFYDDNGTFTEYITLTGTTLCGMFAESDFVGDVDNIIVTEANPLDGDTTGAEVGVDAGRFLDLAYSFDGLADFVDIYSAEINSVFNPDKFSISIFCKVGSAGVWTDSTVRHILTIKADPDNQILFTKTATPNQLRVAFVAGGTVKEILDTSLAGTTDWFNPVLTVDTVADEMIVTIDGVQVGATLTGLGDWVGNLTTAVIGAASTAPTNVWDGLITQDALINDVLNASEKARIARAGGV
jgi:hypothetical protein